MKKQRNLLIILLICLISIVGIIVALQPKTEVAYGLKFMLNQDGESYSIVGVDKLTDVNVEIPSTYNNKPITKVADNVFSGHKNIISITFPEGITHIGKLGDLKLLNMQLPKSLERISLNAFENCSLEVVIYMGDINDWASIFFESYQSSPISISNKLYIGGKLINEIDNVCIDRAEKINTFAFWGWENLRTIVLKENVSKISDYSFYKCKNLKSVVANGVEIVGKYAFEFCQNLESVELGDKIKEINEGAFSFCEKLSVISFGRELESIRKNCFLGCKSLKEINYGGDSSLWDQVKKETFWNAEIQAQYVNCIDGYAEIN